MSDTMLIMRDLYGSLCLDENQESVHYQIRLRKLYRFFLGFVQCWSEHASCPRIPDELYNQGPCDFIRMSLDWLASQNRSEMIQAFDNLMEQNIESNIEMLAQFGVSEEDIINLNNLAGLDDETAFFAKIRDITGTLASNSGIHGMNLLALLGALTLYKVPSSNQVSVALSARNMNELGPGDILFKTGDGFTIINPLSSKYVQSNGAALVAPEPIRSRTNLFPGEFVINDGVSFYKLQSNLLDTTVRAEITDMGVVHFGELDMRLSLNPAVLVYFSGNHITQIDLSSGTMSILKDSGESFSLVQSSFPTTRTVTDGVLSVFLENALFAIPLLTDKDHAYVNQLNFVDDKVDLDLKSPILL